MSTIKVYKSYSFIEKDPIIDRVRTIVQDSGENYNQVGRDSDVSPSTLHAWFEGETKRPQFCTIAAVCSSLGFDLLPVERGSQKVAALRGAKVVPIRARATNGKHAPARARA